MPLRFTTAPTLAPVLKAYDVRVVTGRGLLLRAGLIIALSITMVIYGFYYALTTPWGLVQMCMPLAAMMMVVIWALPHARTAPTRAMERLFFAYLVCLVLWPNYLAFSLPGLPWITLVRLTGFPMVLTLLISLSVSPRVRSRLLSTLEATPWIWRLLVIFTVLMVISLVFSKTPQTSVQKLIVALVNWIAVFFVGVYLFSKKGRAERWLTLLIISFVIMCAVGVIDMVYEKVPWAGHVPPFLKVADPVVEKMIGSTYRFASGEYRAKAVFTTPLGLAEFLALCFPFVMHLVLGPYPQKVKLLALPLIPVAFIVIEATGSRLGMVGGMVGILVYILLWGVRRLREHRRGMIAPAVLLAYPLFAVLLFAASFTSNYLRRRVWGDGATDASTAGRAFQLAQGIPKVLSHPWGYGIGRGGETLGIRGAGDVLTIDNYFLLIALEYGIVGFILFYGLLVAAIMYAALWSTRPSEDREASLLAPLAVALTSFIVIKWVFAQQDNNPLVFMMLGAIVALTARRKQAEAAASAAAKTT